MVNFTLISKTPTNMKPTLTLLTLLAASALLAPAASAQSQPATNCGCQCTCQTCNCPKPEKENAKPDKQKKGKGYENSVGYQKGEETNLRIKNRQASDSLIDAMNVSYGDQYKTWRERYPLDDEISVAETQDELMERIAESEWHFQPASVDTCTSRPAVVFFRINKNVDGTIDTPELCIRFWTDSITMPNECLVLQIDYLPIMAAADEQPNSYRIDFDKGRSKTLPDSNGKYRTEITRRLTGPDDRMLFSALANCSDAWLYTDHYNPLEPDNEQHAIKLTGDEQTDFYYMHQLFYLKGGRIQ